MRNLALLAWIVTGGAVLQAEPRNTVRVRIVDSGGIQSPVLFQAKGVATSILASAGVRVRWERGAPSPSECSADMTIALSFTPKAPAQTVPGALAAASPFATEGIGILLFVDRLKPLMEMLMHPQILLGHVLAHEIGHKLLATDAHSTVGLMKAHWSKAEIHAMSFRPMEFTLEHAAQMKANLQSGCPQLMAARIVN